MFLMKQIQKHQPFSVKPRGGALIITLNTNHPAYTNLVEVLEHEVAEDATTEELHNRLVRQEME